MKRIFTAVLCILTVFFAVSCVKDEGKAQSAVYTVSAEQWTSSMAFDAFRNCEVVWWQGSVEEYNGGDYLVTPAYLSYGDAWFTLKEDPNGSTGMEYRKDGYDWSSSEVAEVSFELLGKYENFTYNEDTKRYEAVTTEDEMTVTRYAGFENGRLTYVYCMIETKDNGSRGYELKISNYGKVTVTPPIDEARATYEAAITDEMCNTMIFDYEGELVVDVKDILNEQSFDNVQVILKTNGSISRIFFSPEGANNSKDVSVRFRDGKIYRIITPNYSVDVTYAE